MVRLAEQGIRKAFLLALFARIHTWPAYEAIR